VAPVAVDPGQLEEVRLDGCVASNNLEVVVDDSGSMQGSDPERLRRRAIELLLSKERNQGKILGAVEFGTDADQLFAPQPLLSRAQREVLARRLARRIAADNGGTNYNAGFGILADDNPGATARLFLTDGEHNEGEYEEGHRGGPPTYVIGLGIGRSGGAAQRLQRIADETKGRYFPDVTAETLQPVLNQIDSALNCDIRLDGFRDRIVDELDDATHSLPIEDGARSADVVVSWDDPDDGFDVTALALTGAGRRVFVPAAALRRALAGTGRTVRVGRLSISGRRGVTFFSLRVRGLERRRGRLRFTVRPRFLRDEARVRVQVSQSRRKK
jgi:hypothetical protein